MEVLRPTLLGVGLAMALAPLVARLGRWSGSWRWPIALGLAYFSGHAVIRGWGPSEWPPLPPRDAIDWTPWLALLAAGLGHGGVRGSLAGPLRWGTRGLLVGATISLMLVPLLRELSESSGAQLGLMGAGLGILVLWEFLEGQADRLGVAILAPLVVLAGGVAGVLLLAHSLVLANFALVLAAALVGCRFGLPWRSGDGFGRDGMPVVVVVLTALVLSGRFYAFPAVPPAVVAAIALAPLGLGIDQVVPGRRFGPRGSAGLRLGAVGGFIGLALLLMALESGSVPGGSWENREIGRRALEGPHPTASRSPTPSGRGLG